MDESQSDVRAHATIPISSTNQRKRKSNEPLILVEDGDKSLTGGACAPPVSSKSKHPSTHMDEIQSDIKAHATVPISPTNKRRRRSKEPIILVEDSQSDPRGVAKATLPQSSQLIDIHPKSVQAKFLELTINDEDDPQSAAADSDDDNLSRLELAQDPIEEAEDQRHRLTHATTNDEADELDSLLGKQEPSYSAKLLTQENLVLNALHTRAISNLCEMTGMERLESAVRKGIKAAVHVIGSAKLYAELGNGTLSFPLALTLMEEEVSGNHKPLRRLFGGTGLHSWLFREILYIICTTDRNLLSSLIKGTVSRDFMNPATGIQKVLKCNRNHSDWPGIYMKVIADLAGFQPTASQWETVCKSGLAYVGRSKEANALAESVDFKIKPPRDWMPSSNQHGFRRYFDIKSAPIIASSLENSRRRTITSEFFNQILKWVRKAGEDRLVPFPEDVVEVGYSKSPLKRLGDHAAHRSSNYIMNLTQALFEHHFSGVFTLHQHIIFNCWRPSQCYLGEIIFTQLANGYTSEGGGHSHYDAGLSNFNAYRDHPLRFWHRIEQQANHRFDLVRVLQYAETELSDVQVLSTDSDDKTGCRLGAADEVSREGNIVDNLSLTNVILEELCELERIVKSSN
ncbi:MAG: hypothetical protein Q9160_008598 [Pyrenula sp. 1 TL-2023]